MRSATAETLSATTTKQHPLCVAVSKGMNVRVVAQANRKVRLGNGDRSALPFHAAPDGAAIIPLDAGYVYVSNAEVEEGEKREHAP